MNSNDVDILEAIQKHNKNYYDENGKNTYFKKHQKIDLATQVADKFDLQKLLDLSCYKVNNKVFIDYSVIKLYATIENNNIIVDKILSQYQMDDTYEIHLNLAGFTITAAERNKELIRMYFEKCMSLEKNLSASLINMYVYYTPSFIDQLMKMFKSFICDEIRDKVVYYKKSESESLWIQNKSTS